MSDLLVMALTVVAIALSGLMIGIRIGYRWGYRDGRARTGPEDYE